MTPTLGYNPAYARFNCAAAPAFPPCGAAPGQDDHISPRHNRKRIRHRPRSRGRRADDNSELRPTPIQPEPPRPPRTRTTAGSTAPTAMSINYSYAQPIFSPSRMAASKQFPGHPRHHQPGLSRKREDAAARELRIFGGEDSEIESEGDGLKAPMLDVVLGLFDGLDYDDERWCYGVGA